MMTKTEVDNKRHTKPEFIKFESVYERGAKYYCDITIDQLLPYGQCDGAIA